MAVFGEIVFKVRFDFLCIEQPNCSNDMTLLSVTGLKQPKTTDHALAVADFDARALTHQVNVCAATAHRNVNKDACLHLTRTSLATVVGSERGKHQELF